MLIHGGRLRQAAARYGRPLAQWLDLSTGINPRHYPIDGIPAAEWNRLPEADDGLLDAARHYYDCASVLAVAGSQAAIQALPRLRPPGRVGVPAIGYAEHRHQWQQAGHRIVALSREQIESRLDSLDTLVLINPNNPTGERYAPDELLEWHARLAARGGWLIVDEAFADTEPAHSLAPFTPRPGLIVLRSVGKFFGLAGARAGFVLAHPELLTMLEEQLGPWPLSGPSRWLCRQALSDRAWQACNRQRLIADGQRLNTLLEALLGYPCQGTALFQTLEVDAPHTLVRSLAERGILVREFADERRVRFGLPGEEAHWLRLQKALEGLKLHSPTHEEADHDGQRPQPTP